jgi:hypothetical protein
MNHLTLEEKLKRRPHYRMWNTIESKKPVTQRIFENMTPEPNTGCWLWTGHVNEYGYGILGIEHKARAAHRVSYEGYNGPISQGLLVMHTCDVRCCVNPDHLRLGTHKDNAADRNQKKRQAVGEKIWTAKLTDVQVIAIREAFSIGHSIENIAAYFKMKVSYMRIIAKGKRWTHVKPLNS